jgi:hypothetical protein
VLPFRNLLRFKSLISPTIPLTVEWNAMCSRSALRRSLGGALGSIRVFQQILCLGYLLLLQFLQPPNQSLDMPIVSLFPDPHISAGQAEEYLTSARLSSGISVVCAWRYCRCIVQDGEVARSLLPLLRMGRGMMPSTTISIGNGRRVTGSLGASQSCEAGIYDGGKDGPVWQKPRWPVVSRSTTVTTSVYFPRWA